MNGELVPPSRTETLLRYSRYIAIVAEQLEAATADDWERMMTLLDERRLIEDELGHSHDDESSGLSLDELLTVALDEVTAKIEADRLDRDQWVQISSGALTSARTLSLRPPAIAGRYPEPLGTGERLDLRF